MNDLTYNKKIRALFEHFMIKASNVCFEEVELLNEVVGEVEKRIREKK